MIMENIYSDNYYQLDNYSTKRSVHIILSFQKKKKKKKISFGLKLLLFINHLLFRHKESITKLNIHMRYKKMKKRKKKINLI